MLDYHRDRLKVQTSGHLNNDHLYDSAGAQGFSDSRCTRRFQPPILAPVNVRMDAVNTPAHLCFCLMTLEVQKGKLHLDIPREIQTLYVLSW